MVAARFEAGVPHSQSMSLLAHLAHELLQQEPDNISTDTDTEQTEPQMGRACPRSQPANGHAPVPTPGSVGWSPLSCAQLEVSSAAPTYLLALFLGFWNTDSCPAWKHGPEMVHYSARKTHSLGLNTHFENKCKARM